MATELKKYRTPLKKNRKKRDKARVIMEAAQARFAEIEQKVHENEITEIVGIVEEVKVSPEEFYELLTGLHENGGVPALLEHEEAPAENQPVPEEEPLPQEEGQPLTEQEAQSLAEESQSTPEQERDLTEADKSLWAQEQHQMEDDQTLMEQGQLPEEYNEQEVRFFEQDD